MNPSREDALFALALDLPLAERAAFLDRECGCDVASRQRLDVLLAAHEGRSKVLPAADPAESTPTAVQDVKLIEGEGSIIGRYRLLEKLGEGGFGSVWAAEQREPVRRRVALKIIKLGMDTRQVVARFEAERQALAMMDHPNIAKVLDAGATGFADVQSSKLKAHTPPASEISNFKSQIPAGRPYFVMELVKGIPITQYCDREKLAIKGRLELFIKVCQAIQHAHQKGVIHRDIKPSNILVTLHDGAPVPKVIDFGIAKATQQELTELTIYTQHHQFIGTPAYMSPEQAEMSGLDIDTRSDIYSLGVLLYELLTGSTPFSTKELMLSGIDAMRKIIREKEPLRPSTKLSQTLAATSADHAKQAGFRASRSTIESDLDWIVMKCLEKDRARRYETANGLAADLKRYLNNEPVVARPPSAAYRFQKAWRRNRVVCTAGMAVAIALLAGVIGTSVGLVRAEREKANATWAEQRARAVKGLALRANVLATARAGALETNLYFNAIALAHRETTADPANLKRAKQLLDGCPAPLRNWEWDYLQRCRYQEPMSWQHPAGTVVQSVAFSTDGRLLASGASDGIVRIIDLARPEQVRAVSNHAGYVVSVAFCPTNSEWIASVGADRRLRLWDWSAGREIQSWPAALPKDYGMAYAVAFSPDGRRLAAPGLTNDVAVYELDSGTAALHLPGHDEGARCVAFSPDGHWIATGSGQATVRLFESATGHQTEAWGGQGPPMASVAFTHDSLRLLALQFDGTVRRWDMTTRRELSPYTIRQAGAPYVGLAVHPGGNRVVTGGLDRMLNIVDPASSHHVLVLRDLASGCYGLAFSPDGHHLAAAGRNGTVLVWDGTPVDGQADASFRTLRHPSEEIWALDLAPNGRSLAAGGYRAPGHSKATVLLWDIPGSDEARVELPGHSIVIFSLAYDPSGRFLATTGDDPKAPGLAKLKVWDLESRKEAIPVEEFQEDERLFSVLFSQDSRWLVAAGNTKNVNVWSATTGRKVRVLGSHSREITKLALSPNGRHLASTGNDDVVKIWDGTKLDQPQPQARPFPALCTGFTDLLAFSPDSGRLAVVTDDDTAVIHDLEGEDRAVRLVRRGHRPLALAFSPDGRWVASGGVDCAVRLWDAQSGLHLATLRSHFDQITRLRFLKRPDGVWLISGSRDGTVKFWDMASIKRIDGQ